MTTKNPSYREFEELVYQYENYICTLAETQGYHNLHDDIRGYLEGYLTENNYVLNAEREELLASVRVEIIGY